MTGKSREVLLKRVFVRQSDETQPAPSRSGTVTWEDLAPVVEGLALSGRPINEAMRAVTQQYDLGPRGCFILSLISGGITFPNDLALLLKIGRSLVTAELNRLTAAGLITSAQDGADRRRTELSLTREGEQACLKSRSELQRVISRNLASYSANEIRLFAKMLADACRTDDVEWDNGTPC